MLTYIDLICIVILLISSQEEQECYIKADEGIQGKASKVKGVIEHMEPASWESGKQEPY